MKKRFVRTLAAALTAALLCTTLSTAITFTDVPTSHWAHKYITQAAQNGWVAGTGNNQYSPEDTLTNAQFVKMLTSAFYRDFVAEVASTSGMGTEWWRAPTVAALFHGILLATTLGDSFEANNNNWDDAVLHGKISRYDMAQMSLNLMSNHDFTVTENQKKAAQAAIGDWATIPVQFRDAVSSVYALKVINGMSDGTFSGDTFVTRAQAAVILCRLADATGKATTTPPTEPEKPTTPTGGKDANGNTLAAGVNAVRPSIGKSDAYPTSGHESTINHNGFYSAANVDIGSATLRYEFLDMVNEARAAEGVAPVKWVPYDEAEENTLMRANDLTIKYQHGRPNGTTGIGGEVIGQGFGGSVQRVFEAWMNSPGHKRTLMNPNIIYICAADSPGNRGVWVITTHNKYTIINTQKCAQNNFDDSIPVLSWDVPYPVD